MESTLVSARVPFAKKEAAVSVLKSLGANTTDLINDAFDFVLAHKALPSAQTEPARDREGFEDFMRASTVAVSWNETDERSYKDIISEGKRADYESLA